METVKGQKEMPMRPFIPYQKLPKKKQLEIDRQSRGAWGNLSPVTRCPQRSDAYDRHKENRRWKADARQQERTSGGGFLFGPALLQGNAANFSQV
jgi:hypothetical protein